MAAWRNGIASDYETGNQEIAGSTPAVVIALFVDNKGKVLKDYVEIAARHPNQRRHLKCVSINSPI